MRFPNTVDDLIAELDRRFPETVPEPGNDHSEIMFAAGRRSVVTFLKRWRENAGKPPAPPKERGRGRPAGAPNTP